MSVIARKRLETMVAKLKDSKRKATPQRLAVMRVLAEHKGHPSIRDIWLILRRRFPGISQATVYRSVQLVKSLGEACEIAFADGGSRYDGRRPQPHPHIVCLACGRIVDPELQSLKDMTREIIAGSGFRIATFRLDFFGLCPACDGKKGRNKLHAKKY